MAIIHRSAYFSYKYRNRKKYRMNFRSSSFQTTLIMQLMNNFEKDILTYLSYMV